LIGGRLMLVPFSILGALICFQWADRLYGTASAFIALALWCFSPNILTWHAVICSDGLATSFGVAAGYFFWRWLKHPRLRSALLAGGMLGAAQLSKMTWIVLFPLWIVLWSVCYSYYSRGPTRKQQLLQLVASLLLGGYVLNMGYAFDGSFTQLKTFHFFSRTLASQDGIANAGKDGGNRFAHSLLGDVPLPLPRYYVQGLDLQRADFEKGKPSYLFGKWSERGWWYYYLVGLLLKTPLGTLGLALLASITAVLLVIRRPKAVNGGEVTAANTSNRERLTDHVVLLSPAVVLFVFVSMQDGFSCHFRYVLPALPFAAIWISGVGRFVSREHVCRSLGVLSLLFWSIASSLLVYPHSMSYFNALAGGPKGGHRYMLDSSFSWSQDIFYLKKWLDTHVKGELPFVSLLTDISPKELGIDCCGASPTLCKAPSAADEPLTGPVPGWHAVEIQGIRSPRTGYGYFLEFEPVAIVGYSIYIYHISLDDVNRVRRKLGLETFEPRNVSSGKFVNRLAETSRHEGMVRIAIYSNGVARDHRAEPAASLLALLKSQPDLSWERLDAAEIIDGQLRGFDLVVFPGGIASNQATSLGILGRKKVRDYVRNGGGYLGICAGAFLGSSTFDWGLSLVNVQSPTGTYYVPKVGYQMWLDRGYGDVQISISDAGRKVFGEKTARYRVQYGGGPVFQAGKRTYLPEFVALACYTSEIYQYEFQKGTMSKTPSIIGAPYGDGKVILISPHLESTPGLESTIKTAIRAVARSR
jgi:glutamine amidotransferase-like uncharacterized protein